MLTDVKFSLSVVFFLLLFLWIVCLQLFSSWLYFVLFGTGMCKGVLCTGSSCCRTIEAAPNDGASWVPAAWFLLFLTHGSFGGSLNWCSSWDGT